MGRRGRRRQRDVAALTGHRKVTPGPDSTGTAHSAADREQPELVRRVRRRQEIDQAIAAEVARLRRAGASWTVLAGALGISRQGVRQRYGPAEDGR